MYLAKDFHNKNVASYRYFLRVRKQSRIMQREPGPAISLIVLIQRKRKLLDVAKQSKMIKNLSHRKSIVLESGESYIIPFHLSK